MDSPASGHGNFSARGYSRGGSRYAPRESFNHHENPPAALVEVERQGPAQPPGLQEIYGRYKRVLTELSEDVEHEYSRRHYLLTTVQRLRTDREKYRSDLAFAQLENERDIRVLRDKLEATRRKTALLRDQHDNLVRDHKNLLGILERAGHLRSRKRPRTDSTGGYDQHKT